MLFPEVQVQSKFLRLVVPQKRLMSPLLLALRPYFQLRLQPMSPLFPALRPYFRLPLQPMSFQYRGQLRFLPQREHWPLLLVRCLLQL